MEIHWKKMNARIENAKKKKSNERGRATQQWKLLS